jgi:hypothetical protein
LDNTHIIGISAFDFQSIEDREKYIKWRGGAYTPMIMAKTAYAGIEHYQVVTENRDYPFTFTLTYFQNLEDRLNSLRTPEYIAYQKDMRTTYSGKYQYRWSTLYQLVKRVSAGGIAFDKDRDYSPEKAPVILLYGVSFPPDDWERYHQWFNDWGNSIYVPVLLKVPGVIEFSRFWLFSTSGGRSTPKPGDTLNTDYPQDLAIIYFENLKAYENFAPSREFAAFNKNLAAEFHNGLNYKWNAVYRLMGRWTK